MVTAINKTIILSCFGHLWLIDESVLRQFYITVIVVDVLASMPEVGLCLILLHLNIGGFHERKDSISLLCHQRLAHGDVFITT